MNKKMNKVLSVILPNKKTNLFVLFVLILGIISGSIFLVVLSETDKNNVINQITTFFNNINANNINNLTAFKNSIIENILFIIIVWLLGMSIIGIFINVFLVYLKGFIMGFSISSFILVFKAKGVLASFIYVFPTCMINILIIVILGSYSIMFTSALFKQILSKGNTNLLRMFKKYAFILVIVIILTLFSSVSESYLIPTFFKLLIKVFI